MMTTNEITLQKNTLLSEETLTIRHRSGLTVYLTPKDMQSSYAVLSVAYGALHTCFRTPDGHLHETPAGIAHFLEHKLFEMPDGNDAFESFAEVGANANAYTTASRTAYLFSCTSRFDEALEILVRMVYTPHFTDQSVRREADIIKQEILTYEDRASSRLFRLLMNNLFAEHRMRESICGTVESIGRITPALLMDCYRSFYVPENMVLSISGRITPEEVNAVLDRVLPTLDLPTGKPAIPAVIHERGEIVTKESDFSILISRPILQVGIKDVLYSDDQLFMTRRHLLMNILLNAVFGDSSALYEELQNEGLLQDKFSTDYNDEAGCAFALIAAETDDAARVIERVRRAIEDAAAEPPDEQEFERLKRCAYADYVRLFDSTEEIAEETLDNFFTGIPLLSVGDILLSLTHSEMVDLCREIFRPQYVTAAIARPLKSTETHTKEGKEQ